MTIQIKANKFYIVLTVDQSGLCAVQRDVSYNFDAAHGYIFAKRDAAEKLAKAYNGEVHSLQGKFYDIKKYKGHAEAKADALAMFN